MTLRNLRPTLSRRAVLVLAALAVVAVGFYWIVLRGSSTPAAGSGPAHAVAQIGEGKRVLLVGEDGSLTGAAPGDSKKLLPVLPLKDRPKAGRVKGHVLEEVHVLAAGPKALRRYVASTGYGETGVVVELTSGIELRFGDDQRAGEKWKAAAAVLANPSVTLLSYVDVHAPGRPAVAGEEHELPSPS